MSFPLTRRRVLGSAALALPAAGLVSAGASGAAAADGANGPRRRQRLAGGWRFHRGDPPGHDMVYDVHNTLPDTDAIDLSLSPVRTAAGAADLIRLKPWIMPSANRFIVDPAARHARPAGNPGGTLAAVQPDYDDSDWQAVRVPHDWAIAGPFLTDDDSGGMGRLPSWGAGWYRRAITVPADDRGKSVFLDVDGAMAYAAVWLNGTLVGGWPYGYNGWRLDLTPHVRPGEANQLAIRLANPPQSARWYPGGGLYRHVWLVVVDRVHVGHWGTRITAHGISTRQATLDLAVTIDNDGDGAAAVTVATEVFVIDADGRHGRAAARFAPAHLWIDPRATATVQRRTVIADPNLWGPAPEKVPHRYVAVTTVSSRGMPIDRYETVFGIRDIQCTGDRGLLVNGERIAIRGTNNHHDLGPLGAAFNVTAARRQLGRLQEIGCNALRMSHNPPAPELLDLADEMGMLVLDEIFDVWQDKKTPLDFHLIFDDWHEADLRAMLRRDRNHPSIFLWSVGNEVGEQNDGDAGAAIARRLVAIAHEEDPTRLVTSAMNAAKPDMAMPPALDAIGLNYQGIGVRTMPGQFAPFHAAFPDKMIFSTESAAALSSRGVYQFPVPGVRSAAVRPGAGGDPETHQVSAYELFAADFGTSADAVFAAEDQHPFVAGEFVWTGWDYLGEPTPYYSSRSSYFGIIDLAGFRKDRFYLYQSRWRPDLEMAHILPHWTWPGRDGAVTPVHVFSSAEEAELFVNGTSQGRQRRAPFDYRFRWDYVVYEPGELKVVTYKNGREWATATRRTATAPAALQARAERRTIIADGDDLAFVSVTIIDARGTIVPTAADRVAATISGPGEIVATANGDPTSFIPFGAHARPAFNGKLLTIVRATGAGPIRLTWTTASGLRTELALMGAKP